MALTYGFYNSKNGDRKYDAVTLSRMFDGIIRDGVISAFGKTFAVTVNSGNRINVDTGRAWFDHTWTLNDSIMVLDCGMAEVLQDRYDAVVLEVNEDTTARCNSIQIIHGSPSTSPVKPTLTKTEHVHQYPLAYILRKAGSTAISQQYIENAVGTSACPLATGVLTQMSTDQIVAQWGAEFSEWFNDQRETLTTDVAGKLNARIDKLKTYSFTLKANAWSSTAPYSQTVMVSNVTADTNMGPMYFEPTGKQSTDEALQNALELLSYGETGNGFVKIYCYDAKPTINITVLADGRI